jgi:quercetin dioxygenase-like cupin family protein
MKSVGAVLQTFIDNLAPMLPADFAGPVRAIESSQAKSGAPKSEAGGSADLPVRRFWPAISAAGGALVEPLTVLEPHLRWVQNPNYVAAPPDPNFLRNYGYVVLAGPGGLVEAPSLALGFLMLGPGTHYPTHRHPAVEIYVVAAGNAEWRKAEEPWRIEAPGRVIRHETMVPHATRTLSEPLLAVYLWQGDLKTHARIVAA